MSWSIPYFDLRLGDEEAAAVAEALKSNWLTMGPRIGTFEAAFAEAHNLPPAHCLAVSSGTAALHLALAALDIGRGDEVIMPALTFVADANVTLVQGATPVFADVLSEDDWTIDPDDVERRLTDRTRAILVVHYGGYPCRMGRLREIAERHRLRVIEDACHAPFSELDGRRLGALGDAGCFSFFSNKNIACGEGGAILFRDRAPADRARHLRSHGMTTTSFERSRGHSFGYDVVEAGYNYRMDELRAALALVQFGKLPTENARRRARVDRYRTRLAERLPRLRFPFAGVRGNLAYHIFPVLLPADGPDRDTVMAGLSDKGIQTSIHYRPIHSFTAFGARSGELPVTEQIAPRILSLPLFGHLSDAQMDHIVDSLVAELGA